MDLEQDITRHLEEPEIRPEPGSRSPQPTKKTRRTPYKVKVSASTGSIQDRVKETIGDKEEMPAPVA